MNFFIIFLSIKSIEVNIDCQYCLPFEHIKLRFRLELEEEELEVDEVEDDWLVHGPLQFSGHVS